MRVIKMPIEKLEVAAYNPRRPLYPGDPEYEKLKRSIEEFGYVDPIVWNKTTGRVVGGHQRLRVLRDLGYTHVQVSVVELDEEREKLLNLALNRIQGEWDDKKLSSLLKTIAEPELSGFDQEELDRLLELPKTSPAETVSPTGGVIPWDVSEVYEPFWAVVRGPIDKLPEVRALLEGLRERGLEVDFSA